MKQMKKQTDGQGLVEYALILVLVAVIVIAILTLLGPQVGNLFSRVVDGLGVVSSGGGGGGGSTPPAAVTAVTAFRANGSVDVVAAISVSVSSNVTAVDSQSGKTVNISCNLSCNVTIPAVGPNPGIITVTADGGSSLSASYPSGN